MLNKKSGFTLIELLVVIAIIGLLSTIVLASLGTARSKGVTASNQMALQQVKNALALYAADNNGTYPATTTALVLGKYISAINPNVAYTPLDSDNNLCNEAPCFSYELAVSGGGGSAEDACSHVATDPDCWSSNLGPMVWANEWIYTNANDYDHGDLNTQTLVALGPTYEAANSCNNLVENGHDDWYLPAINELVSAYNAGLDGFNMTTYLSSTEYSNWTPKSVEWNNGGYIQDGNGKDYDRTMVRCLR